MVKATKTIVFCYGSLRNENRGKYLQMCLLYSHWPEQVTCLLLLCQSLSKAIQSFTSSSHPIKSHFVLAGCLPNAGGAIFDYYNLQPSWGEKCCWQLVGRSQRYWEAVYNEWTALQSPTAKKCPAQMTIMLRLKSHDLRESGTSQSFWVLYSNIYWTLMI